MDRNEYLVAIRALIGVYKNQQDMAYFDGHLPRFNAQLDMFDEFLAKESIKSVIDFGTDIPYTSFYFALTQNAQVNLGCVHTPGEAQLADNVFRSYVNLNFPNWKNRGNSDLVICTECLEHLPTNLYKVRAALCETVKDGGFLLLSFPLNGMNAKDYGLDLGHIDHNAGHEHIREFTEQTAREFYAGTGFSLVCERITWTNAYGGNIMNVLLKKDVFA